MSTPHFPLLAAQRDIWFGHRLDTTRCIYNTGLYTVIEGALDLELMQRAAAYVVANTDALRLRFHASDAGLSQSIDGAPGYILPVIDVSHRDDPDAEGLKLIGESLHRPFDLTSGAPFRWLVVKTGEGRFLWGQIYHHIALDGQSSWAVSSRVADVYSALREGVALPDFPADSIAALVAAETAYRTSPRWSEDRHYWQGALGGIERMRSWSCGAPPSGVAGMLRESLSIAADLSAAIRTYAWQEGLRPEHVLMAAAAVLQSAYQGAREIVLGTPLLGRRASSVKACPAMASNECLIRLDIAPEKDLAALAHDISRQMRLALRHQAYRYEDVRKDLGLLPGEPDIFSVSVNIMPVDADLRLAGLAASSHYLSFGPVRDLALTLFDNKAQECLRVDIDGNGALYRQDDLKQHLGALVSLVAQSVGGGMSSGSLVLSDETPPPSIVPESMTLPDLLAAAKPDPAAIALLSRDGVLTHGEFDAGSNRLARHLIARGIGPESLVAIALPRGAGLVIAVAAVLKAGGGCLLLDPRDASGRQNKVLEDSGAALVLKEIADETVLGGFDPGPVRDEERLAPLQPDNLAFLFYTSGSTGKPKGVALTHANFTNKLRDQMRLWDVGASSRFAFSSSLNFDPAVHQMLLPLAAGGSCVIISPEELADPDLFLGALANASATHLDIVPSVAAVLADRPGFPALEVLILGGEVLPPSLANRVRKRLRHGRLFNMYGPTEACVDATGFEVICDMEGPVPLGRALGGYGVHVLDESRRLLPRGALGEIYIAGAGLARGYWKNAGLTAERFLPCPLAAQSGLMYRTGDRGFFDAQGNLVFAGRTDDQIKIRGVRIEPGEIEAALTELAGVGQAAVIPAGERLIAYVTASTGISVDVDVLRAALVQKLPAVMVPSAIAVLDVMPLLPNGKLDRKSLPDAGPGESPLYVAPASDLEARICALFGALTGTGRVSATDNFFALGGHSLLVMRLLSRLRGECGHDVPVEAVFAHPTPRALAGAIAAGPAPSCRPLVPLREGGSSAPLFCVHPAGGLAAIYTRMLSGIDAAIPVFGLQARGIYDETPPHASIPDMACAYADEICRSAPGPVYLAGWSFGGAAAHEIAALLEERGRAVTGLFLIDTYFSSVADDDVDKAASVMEADGTFFTRIESAVRRSATLLDDHRPRRIHAPVVFLRARDNRDEELVSRLERLTRGPIAIEEMDAGHYALFEQDYAPAVGSVLNRYMTEDVPLLGQAV